MYNAYNNIMDLLLKYNITYSGHPHKILLINK